jgi:hypothetical protein
MKDSEEKNDVMGKPGVRQVAKKWLRNILSTVGFLTLLFYAGRFFLYHFGDAPSVVKEVPSPGGSYKAVLLNDNGGGAISPYCIDTVAVLPIHAKASEQVDSHIVYVGGCGTFKDPATNNRRNGPDIRWSGGDRLEIRFPVTSVGGVAEMRLRKYALGGKVIVTFRMDDTW